ncbi:MAG: hypothetical protein QF570_01300 [Myxococcota bacterium]|nr:hypothetical protein [Myxococcota bacterium]
MLCLLLVPSSVLATPGEPLDLLDPRPREISVYFEVSPREAPHQMRSVFSRAFPARVEPGDRASELRVIVPAATVEAHLLEDHRPIPESFSDFVWVFDVETGHVLSAQLRGHVRPELDWGLTRTSTRAEIQIDMGTAITGGFEQPRRVLGNLVYRYCSDPLDEACHVVETAPYDPATGYVNAVGRIWVHANFIDVFNFSPLGEAIFKERENREAYFAQDDSAVELLAPGTEGVQAVPVVSAPGPAVPAAAIEPNGEPALQ